MSFLSYLDEGREEGKFDALANGDSTAAADELVE